MSVLVGLFAVWQLVAIPATNLMLLVPLRPSGRPPEPSANTLQARGTFTDSEPLQRTAEAVGRVLEFWTEASGQEQGWSLFTPGPPPYSVFVATEFQWADGSRDTLLSRYEPRDLTRPPLRAPLIHYRDHHFETQFVYPVWYASAEAIAEHPQVWTTLPDEIRASGAEIRAWLRGRLSVYSAANPHRTRPTTVVLKHRYISTPDPKEPADVPRTIEERPYARWHPDTNELEAFDVVAKRFVAVREGNP
ncbi:hypothetical protein [Gemmata obscuriglobus]|uniref:hypothetical protein n=1 Tax=Gemmata obscuriglobus TaxID=114 RepID=UPI0011CE4C76|nr:hypothetical protein [Gemmata obscuriglobus]